MKKKDKCETLKQTKVLKLTKKGGVHMFRLKTRVNLECLNYIINYSMGNIPIIFQ